MNWHRSIVDKKMEYKQHAQDDEHENGSAFLVQILMLRSPEIH